MKAFVYENYGSPDVLEMKEVEKPAPKDNELLVRVYALSGNPYDWHHMRGEPFVIRFESGRRKPERKILGVDFAGVVEAVGKDVTKFQPGDEVFGGSDLGAFAEYLCTTEGRVAHKPANISFEEAAAIPIAALTAVQSLRKGEIEAGQKVLVNGASGGVGTYAIQLAKHFDAEVTAVCSTKNLEMVRSLGAEHTIDYTQENFTRNGQQYDLILDAVGNHSIFAYKRLLAPRGHCVIIGFGAMGGMLQAILFGALLSKIGSQKIGLMMAKITNEDLTLMAELMENGKMISVIDQRYPFDKLPEAIRYLETGRARGKVVITLEASS